MQVLKRNVTEGNFPNKGKTLDLAREADNRADDVLVLLCRVRYQLQPPLPHQRRCVRPSLDLTPLRGTRFCGVIAVSTLIGVALGFTRIDLSSAIIEFATLGRVVHSRCGMIMA